MSLASERARTMSVCTREGDGRLTAAQLWGPGWSCVGCVCAVLCLACGSKILSFFRRRLHGRYVSTRQLPKREGGRSGGGATAHPDAPAAPRDLRTSCAAPLLCWFALSELPRATTSRGIAVVLHAPNRSLQCPPPPPGRPGECGGCNGSDPLGCWRPSASGRKQLFLVVFAAVAERRRGLNRSVQWLSPRSPHPGGCGGTNGAGRLTS